MAGKKDYSVVAVVGDLTKTQAANISAEFMKVKNKCAPYGRGTIASGERERVGGLIQKGIKRIGGK